MSGHLKLETAWTEKKTDHQFDNFVIIGVTVSCHNDNLQCHQWWKICQIDNVFVFSVVAYSRIHKMD